MSTTRRAPAQSPELPGFVFQRLLGSGGFSDVYLYEQQLPRRLVAVKVLLGGDDLNETSRQAFIGEANLMAQVSSHPYIVTIFHADVAQDGRPYFVMEYAPGKSLSERYKTETIPIEEVLRTGVRVSSAVATAHQVGILHRDIKPANILSNDYGWPALTDFGISSAVDDDLADAAQGAGASAGMSVPWSPPEMFDDDPNPDVRSEVFSLAATIYTIAAGHSPFEQPGKPNGTIELIARIERGQITPITRPDVPRTLISVLQRAMSVRPNDRYQSAIDFARALQRVELELGYPPTPIDVPKLHIAAPDRSGAPDGDETSIRHVENIDAQGAYEGSRASQAERTSTRAIARVAAQQTTTPQVASGWSAAAEQPTTAAAIPRLDPSLASAPETPAHKVPDFGAAPELRINRGSERASTPVFERQRIELPEDTASGADIAALRSRGTVSQTSSMEHRGRQRGDHENPYGDAPKPKNSNLLVGILAGIIVVLIAVLVVLGWVFRPKDTPTGQGDAGQGPVTVGQQGFPPAPVAPVVVRSPDGYITFRWQNPDPQNGDTYYWRVSDKSQPGETTDEPTAVVGPSPEGVKVCIDVEIRRNGKTSAEPLVACYPQGS